MLHANLRDEVWNIAVIISSPYQIRGSSHLRLLEKPFVICLHILQISGDKKPQTADAQGFQPMASILFAGSGGDKRDRTADLLNAIQAHHKTSPNFGSSIRHPLHDIEQGLMHH